MTQTVPGLRLFSRMLLILPALCCGLAFGSRSVDENIIPNGDFSQGNTGFSSQLPYIKPAENCLWGGYYTVAPKFSRPQLHILIQQKDFSAPTRRTGEEKVLFANAGGTEPLVVWTTRVKCQPNTKYLISFDSLSMSGDQYDGNPSRQAPSTDWAPDFEIWANEVPSSLLQAGVGKYYKQSMIWQSLKATSAVIKIVRAKMNHGGGIVGICNIQMVPVRD